MSEAVAHHDWGHLSDGVWINCPKCKRALFAPTVSGDAIVTVGCPQHGPVEVELVGWIPK